MEILSEHLVNDFLKQNLESWSYRRGSITRDYNFRNFSDAFLFMTAVAFEAEKADHHPDWSNSYNKVSVALRTHSANGITQKDFNLATIMDKVYKKFS